jgi:hypothetical protein
MDDCFSLHGARLDHFLLGLRLTYADLTTPHELAVLLDGARALFGRSHHADNAAATDFLKLWPAVALRDGETAGEVWPLLGALRHLGRYRCGEAMDEDTACVRRALSSVLGL